MYPALFIDRDGVIIENRDQYVRSWDDVAFFPGAPQALAHAAALGWRLVIVTNQAGIGKGLIPLATAQEINRRLVNALGEAGASIDGVYLCPHTTADHCACRKPKPGMILQAADELALDLSRSAMIGDALSDVQAGQAAGLPRQVLVATGRGAEQAHLPQAHQLAPFLLAADLDAAVPLLGRPHA
jgi:D-glycero-D-manno-heptose 1,7-bisphosphate phosphatase